MKENKQGKVRYLSPDTSKITLPNIIRKQYVDNGQGVMSGTFYTIRNPNKTSHNNPFN